MSKGMHDLFAFVISFLGTFAAKTCYTWSFLSCRYLWEDSGQNFD
jgi:hypothetical protein